MSMVLEVTGKLVFEAQARGPWCVLPYPDHPKGCPNFNKKDGCPPRVKRVQEVFDLTRSHWFIGEQFDMKAHKERMLATHPGWSDRQATCCLYWQGGVRKRLREACKAFTTTTCPGDYVGWSSCPEAMGIDVFSTMQKLNIPLERNPQNTVWKIALAGWLLKDAKWVDG